MERSSWLQVPAQARYKEGTQTAVTPPGGTRAYAGHSLLQPSGRSPSPVEGRGHGCLGLSHVDPRSPPWEPGMYQLRPGTRPERGRPAPGRRGPRGFVCLEPDPHFLSPPPSRSLSPGPKSQWRLQQLAREEGAAGGGGGGGGCGQRHPLPRHRCRFRQRCLRAPPTGLQSALRRPPALFLGRS